LTAVDIFIRGLERLFPWAIGAGIIMFLIISWDILTSADTQPWVRVLASLPFIVIFILYVGAIK